MSMSKESQKRVDQLHETLDELYPNMSSQDCRILARGIEHVVSKLRQRCPVTTMRLMTETLDACASEAGGDTGTAVSRETYGIVRDFRDLLDAVREPR